MARGADAPLTSPVAQQPCIAYRLVVEEPAWRQVLERAACAPFVVQDGAVMLRVRGPFQVLLHANYRLDFGNDVQRRIAQMLEGEPIARDHIYTQNYRFFEALIRSGDRVAVEGFASVTVDPAGERDALREPPLLYTLTGTAERPAVIAIPEPGSVAP